MKAYIEHMGTETRFLFGRQKIRFQMNGVILYMKLISWNQGIAIIEANTRDGKKEVTVDVYSVLKELGYDADGIIACYDELELSWCANMSDKDFALYKKSDDRFQISCSYGSVLLDSSGNVLASGLNYELEKEAVQFLKNEQVDLIERKQGKRNEKLYMDRMPDLSTKNYILFRDGEIYYGAWKLSPEKWCILTRSGVRAAFETPHSIIKACEEAFEYCSVLTNVPYDPQWQERDRQIFELGFRAKVVKYGIAFYKEKGGIRAIPLGWSDEYALMDGDAAVIESTMTEERLERARKAYRAVEYLWKHK